MQHYLDPAVLGIPDHAGNCGFSRTAHSDVLGLGGHVVSEIKLKSDVCPLNALLSPHILLFFCHVEGQSIHDCLSDDILSIHI